MSNISTDGVEIQLGDFDLFVGMDVDKRSIALTLINDIGQRKSLLYHQITRMRHCGR